MRAERRSAGRAPGTNGAKHAPETAARRAVRDSIRAWWGNVLTGRPDVAHPTYGPAVHAHMDGDTLILAGTVPSADDRRELAEEAERLLGRGIARVRNQLRVALDAGEARGVYLQTFMCDYVSESQAAYAQAILRPTPISRPTSCAY
ncbi:MAG TPA: hypothetical protein VIC85_03900 [Ktedonobacterales bacterium]